SRLCHTTHLSPLTPHLCVASSSRPSHPCPDAHTPALPSALLIYTDERCCAEFSSPPPPAPLPPVHTLPPPGIPSFAHLIGGKFSRPLHGLTHGLSVFRRIRHPVRTPGRPRAVVGDVADVVHVPVAV